MGASTPAKPTPQPSYLGGMPPIERALAIALALKAAVPAGDQREYLRDLVKGGYVQFMTTCRKPLANWGATNADLDRAWQLVCFAHYRPAEFNRFASQLMSQQERRNRVRVH